MKRSRQEPENKDAKQVWLIDLDNTVVDTDGALCRLFPEAAKAIQERTEFEYAAWIEKLTRPAMEKKGFFQSLEPLPGAVETILELCKRGIHIVFVSSPLRNAPYCEQEKRAWIEKAFGSQLARTAMLVKDKSMVKGRYLFDDKPDQGNDGLFTPEWELIHYERPYNRSCDRRFVVEWNIKNLEKFIE